VEALGYSVVKSPGSNYGLDPSKDGVHTPNIYVICDIIRRDIRVVDVQKTALLATFIISCVLPCFGLNLDHELPLRYTAVSPNGAFTAIYTGAITITCKSRGSTVVLKPIGPVFYLGWAPDSNSIFTVEHLAGGSELAVFHLVSGKWVRQEFDLPEIQDVGNEDLESYKISSLRFDHNHLIGTYLITFSTFKNENRSVHQKELSFRIDTITLRYLK
jgi:hypothetical protein